MLSLYKSEYLCSLRSKYICEISSEIIKYRKITDCVVETKKIKWRLFCFNITLFIKSTENELFFSKGLRKYPLPSCLVCPFYGSF